MLQLGTCRLNFQIDLSFGFAQSLNEPQKEKRRNRVAHHGPKFQSFCLFESARSQLYLKNTPTNQKTKQRHVVAHNHPSHYIWHAHQCRMPTRDMVGQHQRRGH